MCQEVKITRQSRAPRETLLCSHKEMSGRTQSWARQGHPSWELLRCKWSTVAINWLLSQNMGWLRNLRKGWLLKPTENLDFPLIYSPCSPFLVNDTIMHQSSSPNLMPNLHAPLSLSHSSSSTLCLTQPHHHLSPTLLYFLHSNYTV